MNDRVSLLLEELCEADPSLRAHGAELRKLVAELLAARPDVTLDSRFVAELRTKLLDRARGMSSTSRPSFIDTLMRNKLFYAVPGLALVAVVAIGVMTLRPGGAPTASRLALQSGGAQRLGDGAFGSLADAGAPGQAEAMAGSNAQSTRPQSGGAGLGAAPSAALPLYAGGDQLVATDAKMIAPGEPWFPTVYSYVYEGEAIDGLLSPKVDVIKSTPAVSDDVSASTLQRFGLGLADLSRLKSSKVQSFNLTEDREWGYNVWVDLQNGSMGFSQNARWPMPQMEWDAATGIPKDPVRQDEIPAEAELARIADAFLSEYGIDASRYGRPVVRDWWTRQYAATPDKANFYWPEVVSVVYPEMFEGQELREGNGEVTGLEVSVHVRLKRVINAYNLNARSYAVSSYEGETDAARILKLAAQGGVYAWQPEGDVKRIEVKLGTPKISLTRTWLPSGEVFVPSLVFPVTQPPADDAWMTSVVIPLPKELLQSPVDDGPRPMPLELMIK